MKLAPWFEKALARCVAIILAVILSMEVASADSSILLERSRQPNKTSGPLVLFIGKDGRLLAEGEPMSFEQLRSWEKKAKGGGEVPTAELVLCPKIKSNSDLPKIKTILDYLTSINVSYNILIQPKDWVPY